MVSFCLRGIICLSLSLVSFPSWAGRPELPCAEGLRLAYGFDVAGALASTAGLPAEDIARLAGSAYETESVKLVQALLWWGASENRDLQSRLFKALHEQLEHSSNLPRRREQFGSFSAKSRFTPRLHNLRANFPEVPDSVWALTLEWLESRHYPIEGRPPTKDEVLLSIRHSIAAMRPDERTAVLQVFRESGLLKVSLARQRPVGAPRGARVAYQSETEVLLNLDRKLRLIERVLQQLVFGADRFLGVLPAGSYRSEAASKMVRLGAFITGLMVNRDETGSFYTSAAITAMFRNSLAKRLQRWQGGKFLGINFSSHPHLQGWFIGAMAKALGGRQVVYAKPRDLGAQHLEFLRGEIRLMALQAKIESGELDELEVDSASAAVAEIPIVESQEESRDLSQATDVNLPVDATPSNDLGEELERIVSEMSPPPPVQQPPGPAHGETVAPTKRESLPQSRRRRREPLSPAALDRVREEVEFERALPRLQMTQDEILGLVRKFSASSRHEKILFKQLEQLRRLETEASYDRILQSIGQVLIDVDNGVRVQDRQPSRHLKKLTQPKLWEIKPQGRTPVRLILGLDEDGFGILGLLPRAKNNPRETARILDSFSEEWSAGR